MYSYLTFLLAIGFAASISLPTGQYKYESQILTRAPRGDLTAAGLRLAADVLIAPTSKADSYLVHFKHVHLSSLNGINPASSWSKIIHDEYWTLHKDSSCKGDLCSLTKPFLIRVKQGVVQDIVVEESELKLSVNIKKGFAWEYQKLMLQENTVYQQLPTHYGYCDLRTILKSNATSEQFLKPIKKIHIAPVRETCRQYPTNTDSIINEVKSTAEVMDGKVYNLYTVQTVQLRISKMDKTEFITQVNQTISYQGNETTELPPVKATIPIKLVPTVDDDKIGGDKFVQKVFDLLLSFTQNLTSDHGKKSLDLLHLLRVADKISLMKLYTLVKLQPKNWTTLYSFLSIAESCEANEILFLAMEEKAISLVVLPEVLEKQYRNTKRCSDLVSRLKKIIDSKIWDEEMTDKAYMVLSSLTTRYPEYIPEVWPIIEELMSTKPDLALKMAGNLGHVMRLFPQVQTRELKILTLETLRHSNESDVPKALIESFKMYANCTEHEEIRMLALKTYLYLSPLNESWADIKVVQKKNCSWNIRSYIEDILTITANRNFPTEKPMAKKACDLKNMLTLLTPERSLLNINVSRAYSLPFYCEKSNMGVALQAELIHSSNVTDLPEDRISIIILKIDTFGLGRKMEPLEIQLMLPTEVLKRIVQLPSESWKPEMLEEVYNILSEIEIRIFIQNVEYTSLPNVQEAVRRVYERYLALQQSGINQVAVPLNAVYRLPTSLGVTLRKQLTVFVIARAYPSLLVDTVQRVLESLPIVLTSAEIKVSVENAYMSLKTGSRIDAWSDLRILDTHLSVTENRIRIVKKLSRWEDKSIFYASVTPIASIQVFRPSGYFIAFNSLSVQTPAKRNYIKSLVGLKRPEILLETTGYVEAESIVKPWTTLFREQYLMVDMRLKKGSDEDLIIDMQRIPDYVKAKKLGEQRLSKTLNISVSRGLEVSKVLIHLSKEKNLIVRIISNVSLVPSTDVGISDAKFEIEVPSKIEPECILNKNYLVGQLAQKPWTSLFSQFTCNQTKYPRSYGRLLDIIGWAVSNEEMSLNYDNMFSEIMLTYNFEDTLQWPSLYELVKSVNILSEKVKQLKVTITPNCSDEQKQAVVLILQELRKTKTAIEQLLKEPVQEGLLIELLMRREVVVNWVLQKYAGLLFHISMKVNRTQDLLDQTLQDYSKFVTETIPVWQDNSKRYSSVIQKASEAVSADLQNLVQETTDYMESSFRIMTDATNVDQVESLYKVLIKKMTEITQLIQLRSLGNKVNPYLWIRSQSIVVLQNVADISVYLLNQQPLMEPPLKMFVPAEVRPSDCTLQHCT
ncbi:uncharacterized protein LOC115215605 [Octopus sinensis]|uniref:Uncharacterized protein LOC115215605 n=1 Tax=Octopus sinensis TaxID=2607531 RepID=A0A6P7SRB5_9MOLL|nr:uncharacterized protein LOC115215605 [Octopus sinensis]